MQVSLVVILSHRSKICAALIPQHVVKGRFNLFLLDLFMRLLCVDGTNRKLSYKHQTILALIVHQWLRRLPLGLMCD